MIRKEKLGTVCDILNGFAFKSKQYTTSGIRIIRIQNVQHGYIEDKTPVFYPSDTKGIESCMLKENDILLSLTGNVGRIAKLKKEYLPCALNQRVACIRPKVNYILNDYIYYCLSSQAFERDCIFQSHGTAQLNMSTEWLKNYEIVIPSIEEQEKIVAKLDLITEMIECKEYRIKLYDELVKSKFVEMFGDPVFNTKNYPELTLPEMGDFGRGVSKHRPRNDPALLGGDYPLIQTGDVANTGLYITEYNSTYSELGLKQSKMWNAGTLCITIAANIAKTAILTFDACFPDSVVGFKANEKTNNIFIHYWFSFLQKLIEEQAPETAQKNINLGTLSKLLVIAPPIEEQNQFAEWVSNLQNLLIVSNQTKYYYEELLKAEMHKYFDEEGGQVNEV